MIEKMLKAMIVVRERDRDGLLSALRDLGVLHLQPVDADRASADEKLVSRVNSAQRVLQILEPVVAVGDKPDIAVDEVVDEVLRIDRTVAESKNKLTSLHRQLQSQEIWGDVRTEQFAALREAGLNVRFFAVKESEFDGIEAATKAVVGRRGKDVIVGVVEQGGSAVLPGDAIELELPKEDNVSLKREAAEIDAALQGGHERLSQLANLRDEVRGWLGELQAKTEYDVALKGGLSEEKLYAVQGWVPARHGEDLGTKLSEAGIDAGINFDEPGADEQPPTLITRPGWTKPIEGLFGVLGTVAGYREFDVSVPFMIALPIFSALLIGDGGYGALLFFGLLFGYKKVAPKLGDKFTQLMTVVGATTLIWGFITATFFGFTLYKPLIPVDMSEGSRMLMMRISFAMGAIHLCIAQLWQGIAMFPHLKCLSKVGWATFIWGMYGVVQMFVLNDPVNWSTPWPYLLVCGAFLILFFTAPSWNVGKAFLLGLADFPLNMLSAFSDVISYVRLMAVGLASSVLAVSFNNLALPNGDFSVVSIPVLIFGHGLNFGLALIALFAHGVRLNMLEFSNNLGMQWAGYEYSPFAKPMIQEK